MPYIPSDRYAGLIPRDAGLIVCQTNRAPDYYGLGVRLGIYFSWLQAYIANNFIASEIAGASDTNNIFMVTLLVAMIKCSSINMLEQVDGLILMRMQFFFAYALLIPTPFGGFAPETTTTDNLI